VYVVREGEKKSDRAREKQNEREITKEREIKIEEENEETEREEKPKLIPRHDHFQKRERKRDKEGVE